jgi:hypothetical protein
MADEVKEKKNYYGVAVGRKIGIYLTYGYSHKQTDKVSGALHQGFMELEECLEFMRNHAEVPEEEWQVYDSRGRGTPLSQFMDNRSDQTLVKGAQVTEDIVHDKIVLNPVLTYITSSFNNSPMPLELIRKCCHEYYTLDELVRAKELLWKVGEANLLPPFKRRRDGPTRPETDAVLEDLTNGIQKLGENDQIPHFAVDAIGLNRVPRVMPSEMNPISMCERLVSLEQRMKAAEEVMSLNVGRALQIEENVSRMTSYAAVAGRTPQILAPRSLISHHVLLMYLAHLCQDLALHISISRRDVQIVWIETRMNALTANVNPTSVL